MLGNGKVKRALNLKSMTGLNSGHLADIERSEVSWCNDRNNDCPEWSSR